MTWIPHIDIAFPLPTTPHIPGSGSHPDSNLLHNVAHHSHPSNTASSWPSNTPYLYGFALYRAGFYWEAHEVWEPVWMQCTPNSRERYLLQALIQLTNAQLKLRMNRPKAAARLVGEAQSLASDLADLESLMGVTISGLRRELAHILDSTA